MEIIDAASDGRAIARHNERVIFVEDAVPGDIADIHVYKKEKRNGIGKIVLLKKASSDRVEPVCQHFAHCGGCKWQHMSYEAQLKYKENQVRETLRRIGKVEANHFYPILGSQHQYHYRNKLEFTFSNQQWLTSDMGDASTLNPNVLGFHVPRVFYKILDIAHCHLQHPIINDIRNAVREYARKSGEPFYDHQENKGFYRSLVFRTSEATGALMVMLIVAERKQAVVDALFTQLEKDFPEITDFVWMVNAKQNSSYSELPYEVWKGNAFITEKLGNYQFRIRPTSFFQTNPKQAEGLYEVVKNFLQKALKEGESSFPIVYDLYSGTGSIGIFISEFAQKIVGIEYVESAVQDAWENVRLNGLENKFQFYAGDMKALLRDGLVEKEGSPSVIIADPPRGGMIPKVVERIIKLAPDHIIYVSCKPSTQARDIELMKDHYELLEVQPVDMFPQTAHVENVAWLKRKE